MKIIKQKLPILHAELYQVARGIHITGLRVKEILNVRFCMVDYINSCINLSEQPYNSKGELISKTTAYRQIPIPKFYLDWIKERSKGCSPDDYLFSWKLKPGPKPLTVVWIDILWKRHVRVALGINVSIYSFKGLGGDAKGDAGVDTTAVSAGYGHTTTWLAKKVYLKKEGERLRRQVIEKTPDL